MENSKILVTGATGAIGGNAVPIFAQWIDPLKDLGVSTISLSDTGGTDHEAFDAIGIPGFQFIQDPLDYGSRTYHSNMDQRFASERIKRCRACVGRHIPKEGIALFDV